MSGSEDTYETKAEALKDPKKARQYWLDCLDAADKEEKDWRKVAEATEKIYTGKTRASFNILHSNVETTVPAIYNSVPIADCRPRYNDKNETARKAAQVLERALTYEASEYDIDEHLEQTVRDMEVPGRGVSFIEFDPIIDKKPRLDPTTGQPAMDPKGQPLLDEKVIWASVRCAFLPWQRFRRGPGATWQEIPWVSREKFMTRDELIELAGNEIGKKVTLDASQEGATAKDKSKREKTVWKCAKVHEIWDRDTRQVFYIATGYDEGPLAVLPDPLGLKDFFPTPRPMQCLRVPGTMVPIVGYSLYSEQAEELNIVSTRILALIKVAKYRGVRASEIQELGDFADLDDGEFMPSKEAMALLQNGGSLANAFWIMPLGELMALIKELGAQREIIKQTIFELSGIADIMRGATNANETLGAQQLKAKWGSLRVQNRQKEVQRYCRDIYRIKAEIIAEHFPPEVLSMIAGEDLPPEVLELLKSDVHRRFLVDIETDSTIQADRARDQAQMTQFLTASGQFMQLATASVQAGIPPELPLVIYQSFASKFKLGKQVDDVIAKLTEAAAPIMEQKQKSDAEAKAKADEAAAIAKEGAIADVQKKQEEAVGQKIENEGKQVENVRQQVAPIAQPAPEPGGFVQ